MRSWFMPEIGVAIGLVLRPAALRLSRSSACVLVWRLTAALRHARVFAESAERTASPVRGALLAAVAAPTVW